MKITELDCDGNRIEETGGGKIVRVRSLRTKRALVGAGARILFYPTLLYNVFRNKIQAEFRWWDQVDQFILLGAVPFPRDVARLQQLGVRGVITLNEPYETLVPSSLYKEYGIDHLVIPTRDYLFAPSLVDISQAVDFIHKNATCGRTTYVHCKAGRGRSTTIVLCYLVEYKNMTPTAALEYVRSRRPRVLLAPSQWRAVQDYSRRKIEFPAIQSPPPASSPLADALLIEFPASQIPPPTSSPLADAVLVTDADLEGYFTSENYAINRSVSSKVSSLSRSARLSPNSPLDEDEVLVTHEDLEGYVTDEEACKDLSISSFGTHRSKPRRSRLSCLFASLKSTGSSPPEVSRVPEIRAC